MSRQLLKARFDQLNVGWVPEIDELNDDALLGLVEDLESLQACGRLNLETEQGLETLRETVDEWLGE
jgi:hypothetical protein